MSGHRRSSFRLSLTQRRDRCPVESHDRETINQTELQAPIKRPSATEDVSIKPPANKL